METVIEKREFKIGALTTLMLVLVAVIGCDPTLGNTVTYSVTYYANGADS